MFFDYNVYFVQVPALILQDVGLESVYLPRHKYKKLSAPEVWNHGLFFVDEGLESQ